MGRSDGGSSAGGRRQGLKRLLRFAVSCGYFGYLPLVPGTWGSALAAGIVLAAPAVFADIRTGLPIATLTAALAVVAINAMDLESRDPGFIVIDELAGVFVTMAGHRITLVNTLVGFLLFRLFDIFKPPPVRNAEGLRKGWGIVADDVVAGVYASLCLLLWERLL